MAITDSMKNNIIIGLLVVILILLIVAVSKNKEGYKLQCDDCAKIINQKRACTNLGYPYVYPTGCDNAGELVASKPYWSQASPMWPNGACADQLKAPCKDVQEAVKAVSKDIQGATTSGNASATSAPATQAVNPTTKAAAVASSVPMRRKRREGYACCM